MSAETQENQENVGEALVEENKVLRDTLSALRQRLDGMENLFKRRFDEISMEINATGQLIDIAQDGASQRFGEILNVMQAVSHSGEGGSQVNMGVELEAVVNQTEEAANKIMDSVEKISGKIGESAASDSAEDHAAAFQFIQEEVQNIVMACTFQDMTSQRIRTTLENLREAETKLTETLEEMGLDVSTAQKEDSKKAGMVDDATDGRFSQDDIDSLFD